MYNLILPQSYTDIKKSREQPSMLTLDTSFNVNLKKKNQEMYVHCAFE